MRRIGLVAALVPLLLTGLAVGSDAQTGGGVRAVPVARGLAQPVAFTFGPTGRLVYLELDSGWLRFRNLQTGADRRVYRIPSINPDGERGALGVALHPHWPSSPFVYVYATRNTTAGLRNQVLRIRVVDGRAVGVLRILSVAAGPNTSNHNGGRIRFGPDGTLYVVIGDNADPSNAQDLSANFRGKILRLNPDGSVPATNPFGSRVWAYGIRNSIGFGFDPRTGRLWESENGPGCNDEINRIVRGGNHGWGPSQSCPNTNNSGPTPRIPPRYTFVDPRGLTGLAFCDACGLGARYDGDLLVGSVNDGQIRRFDLNDARTAFDAGPLSVINRPGAVLSLEVGPNRRIFFSDFAGVYRLALG